MKYTVLWSTGAENQLAEIWLTAADRQAVTQAQAEIDHELSRNPLQKATHVAEGLYRLRIAPLQILFELSEPDRRVRVVAVRTY
jgi:mRNA-degrading endonuclease RelE of RelBE toxin-antitoxin system